MKKGDNNGKKRPDSTGNGQNRDKIREVSIDPEKYHQLISEKEERIKELTAINQTTDLLRKTISTEETLQKLCFILKDAYQYPVDTSVRIMYNDKNYTSHDFKESTWVQVQEFESIEKKTGRIEIFYGKKFPNKDEGPFLKEERDLLKNISGIVVAYLNSVSEVARSHETQERLKELACINQTTSILKEGKPIEESLQQICMILPRAWQYPEFTEARITFSGMEFTTAYFKETRWTQKQFFETIDNQKGMIEIFYLKEFPLSEDGPFLKGEHHLLEIIAGLLTGYLNSVKGKEILKKTLTDKSAFEKYTPATEQPIHSRKLLQTFLTKSSLNRDIFHDLMPFKVKEILLVASLYDAYSIEGEGKFAEHVLDDYQQLNLTSIPRITGVSTPEEAMELIRTKHFDLVIAMVGVDKKSPVALSRMIKKEFSYIPVIFLLNNNSDLALFSSESKNVKNVDNVFIWNGESRMFFAMIKSIEDKINVENDTKQGLVRVILLVEDSAKYYSRYLPMLYHVVMDQTRRIIDDVSTDDLYKVLKLRARPKILLASTYEEALYIFNKYQEFMLCLITDVKFEKEGTLDSNAGVDLISNIRKESPRLPIIMQSSDPANEKMAHELKVTFINKGSKTLMQDFKSFITHYLGFGNFVYKDGTGKKIAEAKSLKEFEKHLRSIPQESLLYHAKRNHFSLWLMARGEIEAARILSPKRVAEFQNLENIREYLISIVQNFRNERDSGRIIPFEESAILDEKNIVSLSPGSLGGKGRGLSFINSLISNFNFSKHLPGINIKAPITAIIGTDEFEYFLFRNKFEEDILQSDDYDYIKQEFIKGKLTETLRKKLKILLKKINKPIAVRSSGLFEDSLTQPFSGIFETYLLPNNHPSLEIRLEQLTNAIKLVFASIYSPLAQSYIEAIHYKVEEEKMAVIIQEVVGNQYGNAYYPHISGVAQSYNYYPVSYMKPEEGFAVLALGLGKSVVEGEKAYRFSPKYPAVEITSIKDQYLNSQVEFYAVDLKKKNINLLEGDTAGLVKLDIDDAERDGTLKHCASVYHKNNDFISPGIDQPGPRIVNFANILKHKYIPLSKTIEVVLDVVKEAMGSPVEIEFAVDLTKDYDYKSSFYLLQLKPLLGSAQDYNINMKNIDKERILLYTQKGMGNGLIKNIRDVIYVDRDKFDKKETMEMALQMEQLNKEMIKQNRQYILIGPGRWGTRDPWIGIPVTWPQISNARIIVETNLEGYPLDSSSGSHFFHNVTSMNVGYFSVHEQNPDTYIKWDKLDSQKMISDSGYFKHVRFHKPLSIKMDGKQRIAVITWNE